MASLARLGALTDELVAVITSVSSSDRDKFNIYRESSLRSLRNQNYLRTNQFEVEGQLNGLEERFRVQDREGLADALRDRRDALESHTSRWTPEILHFLLELSDKPTQKSKLSDLYLLSQREGAEEQRLTWEEIAKEDGWQDDQALWHSIDYADSSDGTEYVDGESETSAESNDASFSSTEIHQRTTQALLVKPDGAATLKQVEDSQAWRHSTPPKDSTGRQHKTAISDYQVLREVLFMLRGLPTTLFDSNCNPALSYQLSNVSWDAFKALITSFSECGRSLLPLRAFSAREQNVPLMQVFRDTVQKSLQSLDQHISEIQARFIMLREDVVVSLINTQAELKLSLAPLFALSNIVSQLEDEKYAHPFRFLELLFDAAGAAQSEGNEAMYRSLGTMFFDCFRVYLRPIRLWMEDGTLIPRDRTFFVSQSAAKVPLSQIWHDQFKLRQTQSGALHAPRFLQPAAKRIFTTGKSINVLKHLGRFEMVREQWTGVEPKLDFASVCADDLGLAPFPELFNRSFDIWIQSKHHTTSAVLRQVLFESCGLSVALDSLQHIYLASDGSIMDAFAVPLFRHLDTLSPSWKDHFTLTEIAQEAFSPCVASYRLSARVDPRGVVHSGIASRSSVRLSLPAVHLAYRLDWPVQLVVSETGIAGYQRIFTFLLQLHRGAFVLRKQWLSRIDDSIIHAAESHHRLYWLIRTKLLWFCDTLATYLTSIVLAPSIDAMREGLRNAVDVDDMISVHSSFVDTVADELCLGAKLNPIRDCILDVLDLAIKLEDAHRAEVARETEASREISRLSTMSSPAKMPVDRHQGQSRGDRYGDDDDDDDDDNGYGAEMGSDRGYALGASYREVLAGIHADYEQHLRFVSGGLRGVARAARDPAAGRWDILAEMLEAGVD